MSEIENEFASKYGVSEPIVKALDIMGYRAPMAVQGEVIRDIQAGKDLIVQSKTGSGKTAAFGIPVVDALDVEENLPQVLVLTPTRELAVQVCEEMADIGRYKKIRCLPIYGKQPIHIQLRQLKQRVHVVVGTPGRLADLIKRKNLSLAMVKYLIIDEADELMKRGFLEEVEGIIKKVPSERTTLLFSATMPDRIEAICRHYMVNPERIEVASEERPIDEIKQSYLDVSDEWKFMRLKEIIEERHPYSCLIFCNTRAKVDHLIEKLKIGKYTCAPIHGAMDQKYRLQSIKEFKEGKVQFLVATDLASRGIHIDKLDLVINYNVPSELENYVHRIGRTGRAGEKGEAITFVNAAEKKTWEVVQAFIGYRVPKGVMPKSLPSDGHMRGVLKNDFTPKASVKKHKDITRLRINAGKKKKMRPGDILGAISNLPGIEGDDIGIIDIQDTCSYIEIHNHKASLVMAGLQASKIKGKSVNVRLMKR